YVTAVSRQPAPTTHVYPLSLHDALPISNDFDSMRVRYIRIATAPSIGPGASTTYAYCHPISSAMTGTILMVTSVSRNPMAVWVRSEEHTSELQSRFDLVCRLLLEKKKII